MCRGDTERSQFLSELFLSLNSAVPDQTENLSLPVRLVHPIRLSRFLRFRECLCDGFGRGPSLHGPGFHALSWLEQTDHFRRKLRGEGDQFFSVQSDGRLPDRTLSSTSRPTI